LRFADRRLEVYNLSIISDIVEILELRVKGKEDHLSARSFGQEILEAKDIFNLQIKVAQIIAKERDFS
jgi:hypothetical protein